MKRMIVFSLFIILLINFPLTTTTAQIPPAEAVMDTQVCDIAPETEYDDITWMSVGKTNESVLFRTYIKFDLSDYVGISSATFNIYCRNVMDGGNFDVNIHIVNTSWVDSTTNWNNQPDYETSVNATLSVGTLPDFLFTDLTNLAKAWETGEVTNFGIVLEADNVLPGNWSEFTSTDATGNRPTLDITAASYSEGSWDVLFAFCIITTVILVFLRKKF